VTRLRHSLAGLLRYIQISRNGLFVIVEGKKTDPFFYSRLIGPICAAAGISYDIVYGNSVEGLGGKSTLIGLYEGLESNKLLARRDGNLDKRCLFYLDKDVDDVMHKLIRSPHVVYTPFHCVENALFMYGKLVDAAAAASSLDPARLAARMANPLEWCRQKAAHWKDFLVLCLLSHKLGINCECHYKCMRSPINSPPDAPVDAQKAEAIRADLQARSGLSDSGFNLKFRASSRYVECAFKKGLHDLLFNGKWYFELLRREIKLAGGGDASNDALIAALNLTVDFDGTWTEPFRRPLQELIARN
jgi:hypothetical protein